jgi:hypothetical protein
MKFLLESGFSDPPAMISPVTNPLRVEFPYYLITRGTRSIRPDKLLRGMVADHYCSGVPASAIPYTGSDLGPVGMMVKKTS